jgi:DNA-binding winged helix-turn-helix (wHTH) protein/TolB-like protein
MDRPGSYRFGVFEFNGATLELRRNGAVVPIEPQPARALARLLDRAGEVITRDDLKDAVWSKETHVDFERGLAYLISQIRNALGDTADNPRFVQTLPRKGYKFIAPVQLLSPAPNRPGSNSADAEARTANASSTPLVTAVMRARWPWIAVVGIVLVAMSFVLWGRARATPASGPEVAVVAVSIFDNETGIADHDRLVAGLSDLVVTRLTELDPASLAVIGNSAVLRQPRNLRNLDDIRTHVEADYVILGQLQPDDSGLRFITHFIRLADDAHLKANRLSFPNGDLSGLEAAVVDEFERAVREHVLAKR